MPVAQSLIGGFNAGTNLSTLQQQRRRDAFDMQQKSVENYNSIVGTLASSLEKSKTEFEARLQTAPDLATQEKVLGEWKTLYEGAVTNASRAGQKAASRGLPVDPVAQTARLTPFEKLRDLNTEAALKATAAGQKAGAESGAKQADAIARIQETGRQAQLTRAVPTVSTETLLTKGGAASQPEGQQKFEGVGISVMEDIRQSSGIFAGVSKFVSRTAGQAVEGTNPRLDSEQRVQNFNQEIKSAFTRNPRFPVAELERISNDLLPDPNAIITDPDAEARKIPLLKQHLVNLNEVDSRALQGALSKKGRNDTIDRMATRQAVIDLIGDVPEISDDIEAELDTLQEKVLSDTATEQELNRFIELSQ